MSRSHSSKLRVVMRHIKSFFTTTWPILVAILLPWGVGRPGYIPSDSMKGVLEKGDVILISKLHYGAQTPITPLQLPFFQKNIWGTRIPSYFSGLQLPMYQLPGVSSIKQGDIVIFYKPNEFDWPIPHRTLLIKRCVALPGQKVRLKDNALWVDDTLQPLPDQGQYAYMLEIDRVLPKAYFARHGFSEYEKVPTGYLIYTTPKKAAKYQEQTGCALTQKCDDSTDYELHAGIYRQALGWTAYNWGAFTLPQKGVSMSVDKDFLQRYGTLIQNHEGHQDVQADIAKGTLRIDGELCDQYTWQEDYYFVLGDNRLGSADSRFLGPIPRRFIAAKAVCRLFSIKYWPWQRNFQLL